MTWNAEGILSNGRELTLLNLLNDKDVEVCIVTETEIPASGHGDYNVEGYHSYLPLSPSELLKTAKYRVVVLVRSALAAATKVRSDLMHAAVQLVWIQLDMQGTPRRPGTRVLVCGMYREWSDLARETTALSKVREQLQLAAAEVYNVVFTGNINLDTARRGNIGYGRRCLMLAHNTAVSYSVLRYLETGVRYRSHGQHVREDGEARGHELVLNHICVTKDLEATVSVLSDATRDHFHVVASVSVDKAAATTKSIERRSFKALKRLALLRALDSWPWSDVYKIRDPDKVLDFISRGIVHGLDQAAPMKSITVKEGLLPLFLWPDTLALMAKRDSLGRGPRYKAVRNKVTALVRRDKEMSNLAKLSESGNSPTVLWEIANAAVGKLRQPLPASVKKADGTNTEGNLEAANVVNSYYVEKVRKIRAGRGVQNSTQESAAIPRNGDKGGEIVFTFGFANAGRISKVMGKTPLRSAPMESRCLFSRWGPVPWPDPSPTCLRRWPRRTWRPS
jgi:hypothetical protein